MILVNIGSGNGLPQVRWQAITWSDTDLFSIGPLGTNFCEILNKMQQFSLKKMNFEDIVCKVSAILYSPHDVDQSDSSTTIYVYVRTLLPEAGISGRDK